MRLMILAVAFSLASCAETEPAARRQRAIDRYALSEAQIPVMDAFLEGLAREGRGAALARSPEEIAACYAARNTVPARWMRLHIDYLTDYPNADKDYYAWFAARGVSERDALSIWQGVDRPSKDCLGAK